MQQVIYGHSFSGGRVRVPPSKSAAIRAILCAALAGGPQPQGLAPSGDINATLSAARQLAQAQGGEFDCGESGSLLRFLIPICGALGGRWRFTGQGRLPQRPIGVYGELLPAHGVGFLSEGGLPLEIEGRLTPGRYALPGNISSQFVTGLLMALPLLPGDSELLLTTPLESEGYVNMTLDILKDYGVTVETAGEGWLIPGNQRYMPREYIVEGDWSQAAFYLNMAALSPTGARVELEGLRKDSLQGDRACVEVFGGFGLPVWWEDDLLVAQNPNAACSFGGLRGQTLDVSQITDMAPAASVCAALSEGETRLCNGARLRLKESDRLAAMVQAITALGGSAQDLGDEMRITGAEALAGGLADGQNDHRVLMALAGAGLRSREPVRVTHPWSITKTYPDFYEEFTKVGGDAHVVELG